MTNEELQKELAKYPANAEVVYDIGKSMFSGWGNVYKVTYHTDDNLIELEAG